MSAQLYIAIGGIAASVIGVGVTAHLRLRRIEVHVHSDKEQDAAYKRMLGDALLYCIVSAIFATALAVAMNYPHIPGYEPGELARKAFGLLLVTQLAGIMRNLVWLPKPATATAPLVR